MEKIEPSIGQPPRRDSPQGPEDEKESGQERCEAALESLKAACGEMMRFVKTSLAAKGLEGDERVIADKISYTLTHEGIRTEECRLRYHGNDNIEGSLYIEFEGGRIRFRWAGESAIYLNGYVNHARGFEDTQIMRIDGLPVIGVASEGVEVGETEGYDRKMSSWRRAKAEKEQWLKEAEGVKLTGFFRKKLRPEPPNPGTPPQTKIIPHDRYIEVAQTMAGGVELALAALQQERELRKMELEAKRQGRGPYR